MKEQRIADALGGVDPRFVLEAAPEERESRRHRRVRWGALAACLALAVALGATAALAEYIGSHPDKAAFCLDFKGVFLRLERAGDHITNLAEEIIFYIDAVVLKHSADKSDREQALIRKMEKNGN